MSEIEKQWHEASGSILKIIVGLLILGGILFAGLDLRNRPGRDALQTSTMKQYQFSAIERFAENYIGTSSRPAYYVRVPQPGIDTWNADLLKDFRVRTHDIIELVQALHDLFSSNGTCDKDYDRLLVAAIARAFNSLYRLQKSLETYDLMNKDALSLSLEKILHALQIFGGARAQSIRLLVSMVGTKEKWMCERDFLTDLQELGAWSKPEYVPTEPWFGTTSEIFAAAHALSVDDAETMGMREAKPDQIGELVAAQSKKHDDIVRRYVGADFLQIEKYLPKLRGYELVVAFPLFMALGLIWIAFHIHTLKRNIAKASDPLRTWQYRVSDCVLPYSEKIGIFHAGNFFASLLILSPILISIFLFYFGVRSLNGTLEIQQTLVTNSPNGWVASQIAVPVAITKVVTEVIPGYNYFSFAWEWSLTLLLSLGLFCFVVWQEYEVRLLLADRFKNTQIASTDEN